MINATEETVTACMFHVEVTMFTEHPDAQILLKSLKIGRYDVVFTDRRCFFFPAKPADFWKHRDWELLGRLGGVLGVLLAQATRATVDGIKALLKVQHRYMKAELDELAKATDAEIVTYESVVVVEGHKKKRGMFHVVYFEPPDMSLHIVTKTHDYPRTYAILLGGGEKAVRDFLSTTGIGRPLQVRTTRGK